MRSRRSLAGVPAILGSLMVLGCGSRPAVTPVPAARLDADFVGYWRNSNPRYLNWWEITETHVINYGADPRTRSCVRGDAEVLGPETIRVTFGVTATAQLGLDDGRLVFILQNAKDFHHRVRRRDICFVEGEHLPNAPYPAEPAPGPLCAQAVPVQSQDSIERFIAARNFVTYYYLTPDPSRIPRVLVHYAEVFGSRPFNQLVMGQFCATAIREHPDIHLRLVDALASESQPAKLMGAHVLYMIDTDSARHLLRKADVLWADETVASAIERLLMSPPPDLDGEVTLPIMIDMLWARFSASGHAQPVQKIAMQVGESDSMRSVGGYARWSLISNIRQHARVREIVEHLISTVGEPHKRRLQEVLAEALRKGS